MNDEAILKLIQSATAAAVDTALKRVLTSSPIQGTVVTPGDGTFSQVILDDDLTDTPQAASNTSGFLIATGNRVMCLRYPPSGLAIIGSAGPPMSTLVGNSTHQSIPANTITFLTFDTVYVQHPGSFDPTVPDRIIAPTDGVWDIGVSCDWSQSADGSLRATYWYENGVGPYGFDARPTIAPGAAVMVSTPRFLTAGTAVQFAVYHNDPVSPQTCLAFSAWMTRVP